MSELYHYGVKGMKWGVRRAQKRAARADKRIGKLENLKERNRAEYDYMNKNAKLDYSKPRQAKKLNRTLATNKAMHDTTEVDNNYAIARQKAKKDPSYKKSVEYAKAKAAYRKQAGQQYMYGEAGHLRIESLKNQGYSEKRAKGRAVAETFGAMAVTTVLTGVVIAAQNRY